MFHKKDGGPAFPIPGLHDDADFNGMTLRDYFAAKAPISLDDAMLAVLHNPSHISTLAPSRRMEVFAKLAEMRLEYADAMLAARSK